MKTSPLPTMTLVLVRERAFTLVEVMVSTALVILIMALLISSVDQTQKIWSRGRAKVSQFQAARTAFEAMTRQLSQATLNTYYDVEYRTSGTGLTQVDPINFFRQSEMHFAAGKAFQTKLLAGTKEVYPTHGVFFQIPVGYSSPYTRGFINATTQGNLSQTRELNSLLMAVGYYLKWGIDEDRPKFLLDQPTRIERNRFRLWQIQQPSEGLGLFINAREINGPPTLLTKTTGWIKLAFDPTLLPNYSNTPPRVLAENVVALVVLPKVAIKERPSPNVLDLAPDYEYDSRPAKADGTAMTKREITTAGQVTLSRQFNQLPPIVQVTMVAVDEPSASRMQDFYGDEPPPLTTGLFERIRNQSDFDNDLGLNPVDAGSDDSLVQRLNEGIDTSRPWKLNYRIYTMDVVLRGSKWSRDERGNF